MKLQPKYKTEIIPVIFIVSGIIAVVLRLYFNFSTSLIPGINGAYYPLQVRHILQTGKLSFNDMPFLFYLDAAIVKIISVFGFGITDNLILNVVKLVDSVSLPFLLIPLYSIFKNFKAESPLAYQISLIAYSVLSFAPLILVSDTQKNALAVVFVFAAIAATIKFVKNPGFKTLIWPLIWVTLTALTHFGTFSFLMFFMLIMILVVYRKKALVPALIIVAAGTGIIAVFDVSRFFRLMSVVSVAFERPLLLSGKFPPHDFIIILLSFLTGIFGLVYLIKNSKHIPAAETGIIAASAVSLFVLANPLLDGQYYMRLTLFLFIPQILILLFTAKSIKRVPLILISVIMFLIIVLSVSVSFVHRRNPVINESEYNDLLKIKEVTDNDITNIVVTGHGLEWWTAWILRTEISQDKAYNADFYKDYESVYFLIQIKHENKGPAGPPGPPQFDETRLPQQNTEPVYISQYFKLYKFSH